MDMVPFRDDEAGALASSASSLGIGLLRDDYTVELSRADQRKVLSQSQGFCGVDSRLSANTSLANIDSLSDRELVGDEASLLGEQVEASGVRKMLKQLTHQEKMDLTDVTMPVRHFRAEKGDCDRATRSLKATLAWRKEFQVDRLVRATTPKGDKEFRDMLKLENVTGTIYVRSYNKDGRAVMWMNDSRNNTKNDLDNMRHMTWNIEKAIACTKKKSMRLSGKALEKYLLVVDFDGFKLSTAPSVKVSRWSLNILQSRYPERIHRIFFFHPPYAFRVFWNIVKHFVDPVTKQKIVFCHPGSDGQAQFHAEFSKDELARLESTAGNTAPIREFNSLEYMALPFDVAFDE